MGGRFQPKLDKIERSGEGGGRDESHEGEASECLMFCFYNASPCS